MTKDGTELCVWTDETGELSFNTTYTYCVTYALDAWGTPTGPLENFSETINVSTEGSFNIDLTAAPTDDAITLNWSNQTFDKTGYTFHIYRKKTSDSAYSEIDYITTTSTTQTTFSYTDNTIPNSCSNYNYYVSIELMEKTFMSNFLQNAATTGNTTLSTFKASKAQFPSSVRVSWISDVVGSIANTYLLSRRVAESSTSFAEIYRTTSNESTFYYDDNLVQPGIYYEYQLQVLVNCSKDTITISSVKTDIGFCQSTGTVSGRITYGTGTAVQGVLVTIQKANIETEGVQYRSLKIQQGGGLKWTPSDTLAAANLFRQSDFTAQMFVRPSLEMKDTMTIMAAADAFGVVLLPIADNKKEYEVGFYANGQNDIQRLQGIKVTSDHYVHLSVVRSGTQLAAVAYDAYIDSLMTDTISVASSFGEIKDYKSVCFGQDTHNHYFSGYIDEIRIWSKALTQESILSDCNHTLVGNESNLKVYYTLDEGLSGQVFDMSRSGSIYNENHATIITGASPSEEVPDERIFGLSALTDSDGNYLIRGVPFSGEGTSYAVIPTLGVHEFQPTQNLRYISTTSLVHNSTNFEDISSFSVSGVVYYEHTEYPLEGAYLYVDGEVCSKDGALIATDEKGAFTISVPIGDHFIQVKKDGHTFVNNGRYPADANATNEVHTFDREMSNLTFYDNTLVTIAGRVVGGSIEADKAIGFGLSTNNIGKAILTLSAGSYSLNMETVVNGTVSSYDYHSEDLPVESPTDAVNSKAYRKGGNAEETKYIYITTDSLTGEYAVLLPPLSYKVNTVIIPKNDTIVFNPETFALIDASNPTMKYTDSCILDNGNIETFDYCAEWSQTYYSEPTFIVSDKGNEVGAFGEKSYVYEDLTGFSDTVELYTVDDYGLVTYTFDYPVFSQNAPYSFQIKGFEEYTNYDALNIDRVYPTSEVPLSNIVVTITNEMSNSQMVYVEDGNVEGSGEGRTSVSSGDLVSLASNQLTLDSLGQATYTWVAGFPNITSPYTRGLNITYNCNNIENAWSQNGFFKGVVLGQLPTGSNFVTSGPDKVLMILRDPPGTASQAYWETGETSTHIEQDGGSIITNNELLVVASVGPKVTTVQGTPAFAVISEMKSVADIELGVNLNINYTAYDTWTTTTSTTKRISTSDGFDFVGAQGDVFIGTATNIIFGNSRQVEVTHDISSGKYNIERSDVISTGTSFSTAFNYSANYVETTLLPNLVTLRNSLLLQISADSINSITNTGEEAIYVTTLSPEDKNFGSRNFDTEIWGDLANTDKSALSGPSYRMILPEVLDPKKAYQDMVLWYNEQILGWKQTLSENEEAKVTAVENREEWLDKNLSFDAGAQIESSTQNCSSKATTHERTVETLIVHGGIIGAAVNNIGLTTTIRTTSGAAYSGTTSNENQNCTTTGYTLIEDGESDALTVDVYNAPDNFGAIFRTRGGQTSCPYEGEIVTKYYKPGEKVLSEATMQIEVPQISVVNPYATDIPAGEAATYTLQLENNSETNEDVWFTLAVMSETNTNGANIKLNGHELTSSGHTILVRAGETLNQTLQLEQTQLGILDYENIGLVLKSQCQGDPTGIHKIIADTVFVSAYFIPACTNIEIQIEDRVMNTFTSDTLTIDVNGYNSSYQGFKGILLQYKGERDVDWSLIKEYVTDEADMTSTTEMLPSGGNITYKFPMSNNALFPDQTYQFRARTICLFGEEVYNESETIEVIKDMARPQLLSSPNPSDALLGAGDEISVVFNENIKSSSLISTSNFVVSGVLNEAEIAHKVAMKSENTAQAAATEADINLANRNFAVDLWMNISGSGTIFSHGNGENKLIISVDSLRHLRLALGNDIYTSETIVPENTWAFLTCHYEYDEAGSTFSAMVAYDAFTTILFQDMPVIDYSGIGRLVLGSNLNGAIHEVCLWDRARGFVEAQSGMYTTKAPSTLNLIGYWKLDEGTGTVATDYARSRQMILPVANWYLNNENKAIRLNGSNYIALNISTCPALDTDDYAFEMWFRGENQSNATLFAVGDSTLSARFNADGKLALITNGTETVLSNTDYLDNAWHHFALNVLRNGNATAYVDGVVIKQMAATQVPALAGAAIHIGSNRHWDSASGYTFRYFFTGEIDDIRFWKATLTADLLRDNRHTRLHGNETGLEAYYPFELKQLDEYSQVVTVGTFADQSNNAAGNADAATTVVYTEEAPALQEAITETNIAYSFVASENKIVFTIDEKAALIEGCTINFTVSNVRDVNNNLSEPIKWSVYINQNQLIWDNSSIEMKQQNLEESIFTVVISNMGSTTEEWKLSNLPSWLSVSDEQGSLSPLSSKTLTFTISSATPIGRYEEVLYLSGNNQIYVPFTLHLRVIGEEPDWTVNAADFEQSMNVYGQLQIANILSEDTDDKVAAFVNGQCVGVASPVYYSRYDAYYVIMDIYGNAEDQGKEVAFKVWDASTGLIYPSIETSAAVNFTSNLLLGRFSDPFIWNAENKIEQSLSLAKGWTWNSLYVQPEDSSLSTLMADLKDFTDIVKSKTAFAQPDGDLWAGKLNYLTIGDMYKTKVSQAATISIMGAEVTPSEAPITIQPNWNWIGYNASFNMSVSEAFADLDPQDGDQIKGQSQVAIFDGYEWLGSLKTLAPGKGYMYYSNTNEARNFTYPNQTTAVSIRSAKNVENHFTVISENTYSGNMTMVAIVKRGEEIVSDCEVGVFADNECRAAEVADANGMVYLTIAGEGSGTALLFKLYIDGSEITLDQQLTYTDDAIYGKPSEPYEIQLLPSDLSSIDTDVLIYPTHVSDHVYICTQARIKNIRVTDMSGKMLLTQTYASGETPTQTKVNMSKFADGIYLIMVETADKTIMMQRIVK